MNLNITGHHIDVTPAIRDYVKQKMDRITRHFDHVIDVSVIMTVEKLKQKVEASVHMSGKDLFVQSEDSDMYAAIDNLADKLDRQILKHKEKNGDVHRQNGALKHQEVAESPESSESPE